MVAYERVTVNFDAVNLELNENAGPAEGPNRGNRATWQGCVVGAQGGMVGAQGGMVGAQGCVVGAQGVWWEHRERHRKDKSGGLSPGGHSSL